MPKFQKNMQGWWQNREIGSLLMKVEIKGTFSGGQFQTSHLLTNLGGIH